MSTTTISEPPDPVPRRDAAGVYPSPAKLIVPRAVPVYAGAIAAAVVFADAAELDAFKRGRAAAAAAAHGVGRLHREALAAAGWRLALEPDGGTYTVDAV
ncbi:hypothetical protein SK069_05690 [Patulibacter brassicae]|uniref:Uncharacterized protein n=1 Tax=Patulibacter brassicae TaxID=1705717 RepID=A0ABU4VGX0_9ACTN|nr:hypothetical protein [Patulibacter brassicae]MDX8151076.1 hypothetical protein [Patulibacter brassicae]